MPSRRQAPKRGKITVPLAESMLALVFRQHCQLRHPRLGFWSKGEHEADHRLHPDQDHEHVREATKNELATRDSEPDPGVGK